MGIKWFAVTIVTSGSMLVALMHCPLTLKTVGFVVSVRHNEFFLSKLILLCCSLAYPLTTKLQNLFTTLYVQVILYLTNDFLLFFNSSN